MKALPRVPPFDAVAEFEDKAYICTNNMKPCYAKMLANPKTEISGMEPDGTWIRVTGTLIRGDCDKTRAAMLAANEDLKNMYHVGDGVFEVLYLENAVCTKYFFTAKPIVIV